MAVDISNLRREILTGSFAHLYSSFVSDFNLNNIADIVNTVGLTGSNISIGTATATTLQQCVVIAEYNVLTAAQRDLWNALVTVATTGIAISHPVIRQQIVGIWSVGLSGTRSNLITAQTRLCSRGETLFGESTTVDTNSIYVALTQP